MTIVSGNQPSSHGRQLPPARARTRSAPQTAISPPAAPPEDDTRKPEQTYVVGYRKPPRHTQFKPGQSGNPKGRPKNAKGLNTLARDLLTQKVTVRTASGEKKMSRIEAVIQKTHELAMKGNARAQAELFKLYANAVPDERDEAPENREEDLTATDLATLEELRRMFGGGQEQIQ